MKSLFRPVLLAGLLATVGFTAFAQAPDADFYPGMMGIAGSMHEGLSQQRKGWINPARMQARLDRHFATLKAQLKLNATQEGAWTTFTAAMKPPADLLARRADYAQLAKMPTPERIDKMKALRAQHVADLTTAMDQRGEATKTFYATLTPEQQKVFDANAMRPRAWHAPKRGRHGPRFGARPAPAASQPAQ
jgi:Spy/CpxP family protein refolding chaperone